MPKKLSIVVVIRPDNFRIDYVINENMAEGQQEYLKHPAAFRRAAQEKSRRMVSNKRAHGVAVLTLRGHPRHSDAPFVRDVAINLGGRTGRIVIGKMASHQRQGEYEALLPYLNTQRVLLLNKILEGGDYRPTPFHDEKGRRVVFVGCGPRTSVEAVRALQRAQNLFPDICFEALPLSAQPFEGNEANLGKADFFHGDTCVYFMRRGGVAVYRPGLTDEAWAKVRQYAKSSSFYKMTREEAEAFACNIKENGDILITTQISAPFKAWLEAHGTKVLKHDLEEFRLAGGGPNCLTNEIHDIAQLNAQGLRLLAQQNPGLQHAIMAEVDEAIRQGRLSPGIRRALGTPKGAYRPRPTPTRVPHSQLRHLRG